jgi:hypothetical protein
VVHNARWRKLAQDIFDGAMYIGERIAEWIVAADLFKKGWVKDSPSVIDTTEALNALESGQVVVHHGAYGDKVFLRAMSGPGAVWRETGSNHNRFAEDIPLPVTLMEEA